MTGTYVQCPIQITWWTQLQCHLPAHWYGLSHIPAAEKTPRKCNGIHVVEPRCDDENLMQIFCPMFPVLMSFG